MKRKTKKTKIIRKFVAIMLALALFSGYVALATEPENGNRFDNRFEPEDVNISPARQDYLKLLASDYRGSEMKEAFVELFGNYSNGYILENYATIFDIGENEVDQGLLAMLTMEKEAAYLTHTEDYEGLDMIVEEPQVPTPVEYTMPEVMPEITVCNNGLSIDNNEELHMLQNNEEAQDNLETETYASSGAIAPVSITSNGFTDISFVGSTNNSITLDIWYVDDSSTNNILNQYDHYAATWSYTLGRDGKPAATTQRITVTGLNPGATYTFIATTYDWGSSSWKDSEVTAQTTGFVQPSFSILGSSSTSITVKAIFPSEYQWGNIIQYYNPATATYTNATSHVANYAKSGTYVISGLAPGVRYQIAFCHYGGTAQTWTVESLYSWTSLPAENLQTYTYSNMVFQLDLPLTTELTYARADRMMTNLNNAYSLMHELVGGDRPFSGDKMILKNDRIILDQYTEGWSGQPMLWKTSSAIGHAARMSTLNIDNTEIPFHELGHNFDSYKWLFEPEALAIIKVYYYFSITNQSMAVSNQELYFTGSAYKTYMKSYANRQLGEISYDASIPFGVYSPYGLAYNLANIADQIGWQPFLQTFAYFNALPSLEVPSSSIMKFNLFMTKLRDYSGVDVLSNFTNKEKEVYEAKLGGQMKYVVTVTWNWGMGTPSTYVQHMIPGSSVGPLPYRFVTGYNLESWWSSPTLGSGTEIIEDSVVPSSNTEYYARWSKELPVNRVQQSFPNWCWAACVSMLSFYYFTYPTAVTQFAIVDVMKWGSLPDEGASDFEITVAMNYACYKDSATYTSATSYYWHRAVINDGDPLIAKISWEVSDENNNKRVGAHALVVSGYNDADLSLTLIDPAAGFGEISIPHANLITGTNIPSCSNATYITTFYFQ